jgi:hypothetical protein
MKLLYFLAIIAVLYGAWAQVLPEEPASSIICSQYSDFKALSIPRTFLFTSMFSTSIK